MDKDKYVYGIKCWEKFPDITVSIETITPQVAIAMLEMNVGNRKIKRLDQMVDAIKTGYWELNGATIVFDKDGNLVDGQHRLNACIKANVPITTLVVRGVERNTQTTMDAGYKRKLSDFLNMAGYGDCNNLAAVITALWRKDKYGTVSAVTYRNGRMAPTASQGMEFADKFYESRIKYTMNKVMRFRKKYKGLTIHALAPIFEDFKDISLEDFEYFYGMLMGKYQPTTTVWKLVQKLQKAGDEKNKIPPEYIAAYIVKAWNSFIDGKELGSLQYRPGGANPEQFPTISHGIDREDSERDAA